ncbi:MFS transporter [Bacillus benzoevorans]|uniref:Putative MFS family arabinose efflux permease n=1 Tax=Bacillus benzoevorans TaxID=1456 RepID=A0A7X0LU19_9BACI|nr:MFS transporter [Bacillus benzoevorans]MBB6443995.1 putative MFS family arabinose efflux permease [Bacillus benzoevorans]
MKRSAWMILWAAFSTGVLATIVQFSIPPILPLVKDQYEVTYTGSALLMSLFALATVLAAVPGGFIVGRYGVRKIGLLGIGFLFFGIIVCLLANNFPLLLLGRIIAGIGFGFVSVAAPSAIGHYVPAKMISVAMGIWSTWIPVGSLIMFLSAPKFVLTFGSDIFWIALMVILIAGFLFYAKMIPKHEQNPKDALQAEAAKLDKKVLLSEIKNKNVWWAALAFTSFTFAFFSFNTWISTYLTETTSMNLTIATLIPSIVALFTMISNIYSGFLLKKCGNHLGIFAVPAVIFILVWPLFNSSSVVMFYIIATVLGLIAGFTPTIVFGAAPLLAKRKETIGIAMSIVIIGENMGVLIGPEVFGVLREWTGDFTAGFWALSLASILMLISCLQIWRSGAFGEKTSHHIAAEENSLPEKV